MEDGQDRARRPAGPPPERTARRRKEPDESPDELLDRWGLLDAPGDRPPARPAEDRPGRRRAPEVPGRAAPPPPPGGPPPEVGPPAAGRPPTRHPAPAPPPGTRAAPPAQRRGARTPGPARRLPPRQRGGPPTPPRAAPHGSAPPQPQGTDAPGSPGASRADGRPHDPPAPAPPAERARRTPRAGGGTAGTGRRTPDAPAAATGRRTPPAGGGTAGLRGRLTGAPGTASDPVRILVAAVAVLVFAATTLGWFSRASLDAAVADVAAMDAESRAGTEPAEQAGDENVLVVASDPDGGPQGRDRPDTVVLLHLPAGGERTVAVSIPTGLEINRPPCEGWDPATATYTGQTVPAEARTTLDSVFATGGPRCVTRVVQQLTGLVVTRFAGFDLSGTGPVVAAVNGVEVCVPRPVVDAVRGPVLPAAGTATVDAERALALVRARDVAGEPASQIGRIERQHAVLGAVLAEALSPRTLLDPGRTGSLAAALQGTLVADGLSIDQLLALSGTLATLDAEGVTHLPVPTQREPNIRGHTQLREGAARELFTALREDGPLPEPDIDPAAAEAAPAPAEVVVDVLNAAERDGLAARVGDALTELGFGVGEVADAERSTAETTIRFSPDRRAAAQLVAAAVPSAITVPQQGGDGILQLVLGSAFDETVRAPVAAGPAGPPADGAPVTCA